jgi:hypothetical protein
VPNLRECVVDENRDVMLNCGFDPAESCPDTVRIDRHGLKPKPNR